MRIKTQFTITMALFIITLVALAAAAIIVNQRAEKANEQDKIARSIVQGASELGYLTNDYLIYRESQQLRRWQAKFASFSSKVTRLDVDRPEQQALVRNIRANQQRMKEVFESTVSAVGASFSSQDMPLNAPLLQVSWSRMEIQSQGLISDASRLSQMLRQQMDQYIQTKAWLMYLMLGLLGLFLLAGYMLTYRRILEALAKLQMGAAVIGSGNLDFKIEEKKNDEIGDLSHAFNRMTSDLKAVTASKADLEREIADRSIAEAALRKSESKYRTLYSSMNEGVAIHQLVYEGDNAIDYSLIDVNPAFERITGLGRDFAVGKKASELYGSGEAPYLETYARVVSTGQPVTFETYFSPMKRHFAISAFSPDKERFATVFQDVTARKQAEDDLRSAHDELEKRVQERTRELSETVERLRVENIQRKQLEATLRESENQVRFFASQCLTAQETERKRIAGELHDSIAASLAAIRLRIERMAEKNHAELGSTDSLQEIAARVAEINAEVRRIMADLRPSILDDLGILAAMRWFCREYQKTYSHICVEPQIEIEEHEVPDSLKTPIFRISQEAMNNIAKYSKATLVKLSFQKSDGRIRLTIQDDGQGFNLETVRKGLGLSTMRERAQLSGGECRLVSASGAGTIVRCSWPV